LIELGASTVIDRNTVDLCDAITEAAKGPVDAALDVVGGRMLSHLLQALRQGDHYSSCGAISGPCTEIDLRLLIYKDLRLSGATIVPPGTMACIVKYIEKGLLKPILHRSYPLSELSAAQEEFCNKKFTGNIVVAV